MGLESFKWVLYGDDDTVFFVDGALDMLENLDYNMPYLLSDDVWFVEDDGKHALLLAHRCMHPTPCTLHVLWFRLSGSWQASAFHLDVFPGLSSWLVVQKSVFARAQWSSCLHSSLADCHCLYTSCLPVVTVQWY